MLPIITEEHASLAFAEIFQDVHATDLDPKAVALGAYMTYILLEMASREEDAGIDFRGE